MTFSGDDGSGYVTVYGYSDGVMKPGQAYISNDGDSWTDVTDKDAYTGQPIIFAYTDDIDKSDKSELETLVAKYESRAVMSVRSITARKLLQTKTHQRTISPMPSFL